MKLLIVDSTSESQALIANRIRALNGEELDTMDICIQLSHPGKFQEKLSDTDILVLGPELEEMAHQVSKKAHELNKEISIIRFVHERQYSEIAFRSSYHSRVRKVLSVNASDLDVLQELVGVYEDLCESGKKLRGKSVVVSQAKGGVGATTIAAALAQASAISGARTLLWDLDIESRDMTRSLGFSKSSGSLLHSFLDGSEELSRQTFHEALTNISDRFNLLSPPTSMAACMDLVGNPECTRIAQRLLKLANATHENVIIDTAGRFSPTTCALMLTADVNLIVIDDSVLGMSAVDPVVRYILSIVPDHSSIRFVCSGTSLDPEEILESLDGLMAEDSTNAWNLPVVPYDKAAQSWPLHPGTVYESGSTSLRNTIEEIATLIGILKNSKHSKSKKTTRNSDSKFFRPFMFQRASNA